MGKTESAITVKDVKDIAEDLDIFISTGNAEKIVELYPFEQELDKGATWDLVVEKLLYDFED